MNIVSLYARCNVFFSYSQAYKIYKIKIISNLTLTVELVKDECRIPKKTSKFFKSTI